MEDIVKIMQRQLDLEITSARQKLTSSNLDAIYKLTTSIINISKMGTASNPEKQKPEYSDGTFDRNIDLLYERYMNAKSLYKENGGQVYKDALMESVRRLMSEVYDMVSSMLKDCECAEEKKEIQLNVKKLGGI